MSKNQKQSKEKKVVEKKDIVNSDTILIRNGYKIYFVKPDDESQRNNLRNTDKTIGEVAVSVATSGDLVDEVAIFVRN